MVIEQIFADLIDGPLAHVPSGSTQVNRACMWGSQIVTSLAGWLRQLTVLPDPDHGGLLGLNVRDGKVMITTLRHRLIAIPARSGPASSRVSPAWSEATPTSAGQAGATSPGSTSHPAAARSQQMPIHSKMITQARSVDPG